MEDPWKKEMWTKEISSMSSIFGSGGFWGGSRVFIILFVVVVSVLWFGDGFYKIQPGDVGVELMFGRVMRISQPGWHYLLPAPIGALYKVEVSKVRKTSITDSMPLHEVDGDDLSGIDNTTGETFLTKDENIVDLSYNVFWRVDPEKVQDFLFHVRHPVESMNHVADSVMREVIGQFSFDSVVTSGRGLIEDQVLVLLQRVIDKYEMGVVIERVELQRSDPPGDVVDSFNDVQRARQDRDRIRNEAEAYRNSVVPRAHGEASKVIERAKAYKATVIQDAYGAAQKFDLLYEQYKKYPKVTKMRMYIASIGKILKDSRGIILSDSLSKGIVPLLPADFSKKIEYFEKSKPLSIKKMPVDSVPASTIAKDEE